MEFYATELPKVSAKNRQEIDTILWMLSRVGDLLDDIPSYERTEEHRRLIETSITKLNECEAQQQKTKEQAGDIECFMVHFKSFEQSFKQQAMRSPEEIYKEIRQTAVAHNRPQQSEARHLKCRSPALLV